jgi:REP element-mobilizing transposase RayT
LMPRMARAVLAETPHHVTQRGVNQQPVFQTDSDRRVYLDLVSTGAVRCGVDLIGYCLMSNHAHWIVVPPDGDSLARLFGEAHNRYSHYANAKWKRSGHLWQNRFFSCALDESPWVVKTRTASQKDGRRAEEPLTIAASGRTPSPPAGGLVDHGRRKQCGAFADLGSSAPGSLRTDRYSEEYCFEPSCR